MKKTWMLGLISLVIVAGSWPVTEGGDSLMGEIKAYMLANFMPQVSPTYSGTLTQTNGNFRVAEDGTVYTTRVVLSPRASITDLGYEEGAIIFLQTPATIGLAQDGNWEICYLTPEDEWSAGMHVDMIVRGSNGIRYAARTGTWMVY